MTKQRFRNQIKQCKAYPGADINSEHNLIIMESELKYKNIKKKNNMDIMIELTEIKKR